MQIMDTRCRMAWRQWNGNWASVSALSSTAPAPEDTTRGHGWLSPTTDGVEIALLCPVSGAGYQAQAAGRGAVNAMRAAPCIDTVVPVADQQEGRQAGQPPEDNQLNQVPRQSTPSMAPMKPSRKEKPRHQSCGDMGSEESTTRRPTPCTTARTAAPGRPCAENSAPVVAANPPGNAVPGPL